MFKKILIILIVSILAGFIIADNFVFAAPKKPIEIPQMRDLNAKHFKNPDGTYTMEAHIGHINYYNQEQKEFKEIDTTLEPIQDGWAMNKASYNLLLPKYADDWFEFINNMQTKELPDESIKMRALGTTAVQGELDQKSDWKNKKVIYKNAFSNNTDLELVARNDSFVKEVVINQKPQDLSKDMEYSFEVEFSDDFEIKNQGKIWDAEEALITSDEIILGKLRETWFRKFQLYDSHGHQGQMKLKLEKIASRKLKLTKILNKDFLKNAVYPVRTDTTTSYYAGSGDGKLGRWGDATWASCRDATTATTGYVDPTGTWASGRAVYYSPYGIYRAFLPTDTSGLPDDASITSVSLYIYITSYQDFESTSAHTIVTSQADTSTLVADDYNNVEFISRGSKTLASMSQDAYNAISFDTSQVSKTGYTKVGLIIGHDLNNVVPTSNMNTVDFSTSETANAPYLSVTYSIAPTGSFNSAASRTDGTGRVDISIEADDAEDANTLKAKLEYRAGADCSSGTSDPTLDETASTVTADNTPAPDVENGNVYQVGTVIPIKTSAGSNTVTFDWLSATDVPTANGTYCLKLTVNDGTFDQTTPATTTLTLDNLAPSGLTALSSSAQTSASVTLNWTAVTETNFNHYEIWYDDVATITRDAGTESEWDNINDANLATRTATATTITGLTFGLTYYFKIWAIDNYGNEQTVAEISQATAGSDQTGVNFAISAWVKPISSIMSKAIVVKNNSIRLVTNASSQVFCQIYVSSAWQTGASSSDALSLNTWQHIACAYDGANLKIYINGRQNGPSQAHTIGVNENANVWRIASDAGSVYSDYQGYMDDIRVYKYARSASQIKADYLGGAGGKGGSIKVSSKEEVRNAGEGLVAHWKMDEASWNGTAGEVIDSSGNGNNGTSTGANTTSTAKFGMAGSFDGTDDYVNAGDAASLNITGNQLTMSVWINPREQNVNDYIIGKYISASDLSYGLGITSESGLKLKAYLKTSSGTFANTPLYTVPLNNWLHYAVVYDGSNLKSFINGVLIGSLAANGNISTSTANLTIGNLGIAGTYFNGLIDDVRIYKTARSAAQIMLDYETGPPPVAHWRMDEKVSGNNKTIYDSSGSNNGTTDDGANNTGMNCAKPGKYGSGCEFDGVDDEVIGGDSSPLSITGNLTLVAWVKPTAISGNYVIVTKGEGTVGSNSYYMAITSNKLNFTIRQNSSTADNQNSSSSLTANVWSHVAASWDGSNMRFYINGVLDWTVASTISSIQDTTAQLGIGGIPNSSSWPYLGLIDDVRIYNYVRTQKQIIEDMNAGHPMGGSPVGSQYVYLNLDEGYGSTAYNRGSTSDKDAVLCNNPSWTLNGYFGKAINFDGTNDYLTLSDNSLFDYTGEDITFSAWFYSDSTESDGGHIFSKPWNGSGEYNYRLSWDSNNKLTFYLNGTGAEQSITNNTALADDTWYHVAVTIDSASKMRTFYINGIKDGSSAHAISAWTPDIAETNHPLILGTLYAYNCSSWAGNTAHAFDGRIDEFKIYKGVLSPAEVRQEYNRGAALLLGAAGTSTSTATSTNSAWVEFCVPGDTTTSTCNPPVAWWKFDEKTGQYAYDSSGSGNTGTLGTGSSADSSDPAWKSAGSCKQGGCLWFDGSNDSATGTIVTTTAPYTVTGWAKIDPTYPTGVGAYMVCLGAGGTALPCFIPHFHWASENKPLIYLGASNYRYGSTNINDNTWHHIAFVVTGSAQADINNAKIYIDGREETYSNTTASGAGNAPTTDFGIGTSRYKGLLDDIRIYNYVRTQAQIAWDYNRGKPYARWSMESVGVNGAPGTSTKVYDESFRNNDGTFEGETAANGTISGATWKRGSNCKYGSCLSFDGADDFVDVGTGPSSVKTVGFWVYPQTTTEYPVDLDGAAYIWFNAGAVTAQGFTSPTYYVNGLAGSTITAGSWQYITVTTDTAINASDLDLGRIEGVGNHEGRLDEVRLYDTALTAAQVFALYQNNDRAAGASLENNLIAEWRLDENSGSYTADTHYLREGKMGFAAKFDGTNDYINLGSFALSNTPEGTFEAWVYKSGSGMIIDNRQFYISHSGTSLYLDIYTTGGWAEGTGGFPLSLNLPSSQWYHLAVVKQTSTTTDVYINGVYRTNITAKTGNLSYSGTPHTIGRYFSGGTYFTGLIDDVRVYNYARTASQLKQDYNEGAAVRFGPASGLP